MLKISDASVIFQSLNETCGRRLLANTAELGLPVGKLPCGTKLLRALIFGILRFLQLNPQKQKITANTVSRYNFLQSKYSLTQLAKQKKY